MDLKTKIRRLPNSKEWSSGISSPLKDKKAFKEAIDKLAEHYKGKEIDVVALMKHAVSS